MLAIVTTVVALELHAMQQWWNWTGFGFGNHHFWLALQVMLSFHVQFQEYFSQKSQDLLWEANFCHSADGVILSFMRYLYEMYSIKKPTHCSRWLWCRYQTCLGALTPPMQVYSRSNQRCDCQREFPFLGEGSAAVVFQSACLDVYLCEVAITVVAGPVMYTGPTQYWHWWMSVVF